MIGYGENMRFLKLLVEKELLIGFGVHQKFVSRRPGRTQRNDKFNLWDICGPAQIKGSELSPDIS